MAPVKYAGRTYLVEFIFALVLYTVFVVARPWLLAQTPEGALRVIVIALPVIPIWLMLLVVVRHYRRIDELQRLKLLENVSIAAGVTACFVVSWSLLEDAGLPKLAITWAWPTLVACWLIGIGINALRDQ
ncbi:MAG TPA: hypothetical protein VII49_02155 [Rhizomicrobium sp.]